MQKDALKAILTEILITITLVLLARLGMPIPPILQFSPIWFPIATSLLLKTTVQTFSTIKNWNRKKNKPSHKNIPTISTKTPPKRNHQRTDYQTRSYTNHHQNVRVRKR